MKKTLTLLFCLFLSFSFFGQNHQIIDSLKASLTKENVQDTSKITSYILLGSKYFVIDLDSLHYYNKLALDLSVKNNKYKLASIYSNIGSYYNNTSKSDSARVYFDKALIELDANEDILVRSTIYANYSLSYENSNNFDKELKYSLKAVELVKDNDPELCLLYFNHSIIYDDAGFREESKKYLKLAYQSSKKAKDNRVESASIRQLAYYAIEEKKYDSAKAYLNRGIELSEIINTPETYFEINALLGKLYDELEMFEEADVALNKAKKYALIRKRVFDMMICNVLLGDHELKRKNYKKSSQYFKEFESLYLKNEIQQLGVMAYKSWALSESNLKNYKRSNELMQMYITIQDSLFQSKNRALLANADVKFKTEKKDKEIIQQQLVIEKTERELQKKKTQNNYIMGLAIFLLVASLLTWIVFRQRQKRKNQEIVSLKREHQIKTLESLMEGEEKERFRIAKELHDGINGDLSAIKFKLSSLLEMNNNVIKEAIAMIDSSCQQVRAISHNLVPPSLENFNLLEAAEEYCEAMNAAQNMEISFQHLGDSVSIPKKAEVNVFRIIQELMTNSIKHSEANEIAVQISCRDKHLQFTVEDNGKGYDKNEIIGTGIGLTNIDSRIEYLQATIDVISNEKGTSTTIEIDTRKLNEH